MTTRITLAILISVLCILGCKKDKDGPNPSEFDAEQLKENAAYNNSVIPGVKNVFVEKSLTANAPNQLYMKMAYENDTIFYFGKVDANGKLDYIHTTVLARKNNTEQFVTEVYPNMAKCRRYLIYKGVRDRYVIETIGYGDNKFAIQLLDYNWASGTYKVLINDLYVDGKLVEGYTSARTSNTFESNCNTDLSGFLKELVCFMSVGEIKMPDWIKSKFPKDDPAKSNSVSDGYEYQRNILNMPEEDIARLKIEQAALKEERYNEYLESKFMNAGSNDMPSVSVDLLEVLGSSNLHYKEGSNSDLFLTLAIKPSNPAHNDPALRVFVSYEVVDPVSGEVLMGSIESNRFGEKEVVIMLDTESSIYKGREKLEIRYKQSYQNDNNLRKIPITFEWEKAYLMYDGMFGVPSQITFIPNEVQYFILVQGDNKPLTGFKSSEMSFRNNSNSNLKVSIEAESKRFGISLTTTDLTIKTQFTTFDLYYKGQKVSTVSVKLEVNVYKINISGGNDQSGPAGNALPKKLQVTVTGTDGMFADKAMVNWNVKSGGGSISSSGVLTNRQGIAEISWTLGSGTAPQVVEATVTSIGGPKTVVFNATAVESNVHQFIADYPEANFPLETISTHVRALTYSGSPAEGAHIIWQVVSGGGTLDKYEDVIDKNGYSEVKWTVGAQQKQTLKATVRDQPSFTLILNSESRNEIKNWTYINTNQPETANSVLKPVGMRFVDINGAPIPGLRTIWHVQSGGGNIQSFDGATNSDGVTMANWTLGPKIHYNLPQVLQLFIYQSNASQSKEFRLYLGVVR